MLNSTGSSFEACHCDRFRSEYTDWMTDLIYYRRLLYLQPELIKSAPQIRSHDFWRYINLYVIMYVCICRPMYLPSVLCDTVGWAAGRASGL